MTSGEWLETTHLEFLTRQIAQGILKAHEDRRPARVATGCKDIHGYSRNRALTSYVLNQDVGEISLDDPQAVFKAVNPALCMVRVDVQDDRGRYLPLAAYSVFSVHATALTPPVEVYNADLFAYAQKDLEWTIRRTYDTPWPIVHGLTSGTEGDMAPALREQGDSTFGHLPVDWKEAKAFAQGVCRWMADDDPERYLLNMSKRLRNGKIFLDYLRNDRLSTAVAPLSPRARDGATVSMPLTWTQVKSDLDPRRYTMRTVPGLLARSKAWEGYDDAASSIKAAIRKLAGKVG